MRSDKARKLPESPMEWSKCPTCGEPFSESQDGPLPGQKTYIHANGVRHVGSGDANVLTRDPSARLRESRRCALFFERILGCFT